MITYDHPYFKLNTKSLDYIMRILPTGQLEHLYFGAPLVDQSYEALHGKITAGAGSSIEYEHDGHKTLLDLVTLEYSSIGKGDFRLSPLEIKMPDGAFVTDFVYQAHQISAEVMESEKLPVAKKNNQPVGSLVINLADRKCAVELKLIYTAFFESDVITRRAVLTNYDQRGLVIRKFMSMMIDLPESDYDLITFDGGWIKETHKTRRPLSYGTYINDSTTGSSSNRHNPGIILAKKRTDEDYGVCLGFNLVYSGNHYTAVQISTHGLLRVMSGINPLSTRFNVAGFGVLGYELDLKFLTPAEKKEIKKQIALYKKHRQVFQYGRFYRFNKKMKTGYSGRSAWAIRIF